MLLASSPHIRLLLLVNVCQVPPLIVTICRMGCKEEPLKISIIMCSKCVAMGSFAAHQLQHLSRTLSLNSWCNQHSTLMCPCFWHLRGEGIYGLNEKLMQPPDIPIRYSKIPSTDLITCFFFVFFFTNLTTVNTLLLFFQILLENPSSLPALLWLHFFQILPACNTIFVFAV